MPSKTDIRQNYIVEETRRLGSVTVEELAADLSVSAQTIRRDINHLCDANILRRRHGGAELFVAADNTSYDVRVTRNTAAKRLIATETAGIIGDGATVFVSIGTTPALVAEALEARRNLTVVTNNFNAAMALSRESSNRIIVPGGEMRLPDRDILGDGAIELFESYRMDFSIFGVGGIDLDGSLLDFHEPEVRARECIRTNSRQSILVADQSKFGRHAAAVGGSIADADYVVIDARPADGHAAVLEKVTGDLRIAGEVRR